MLLALRHFRIIITLIIACFIASGEMYSQNLAPNPSFECGENLCSPYVRVGSFSNHACSWETPTFATPDIYSNTIQDYCYSFTGIDGEFPPGRYKQGVQNPHTGNRYVGIYGFHDNGNYREYIQAKMEQPLEKGEKYCSEFFISLGDLSVYACNSMSVMFSQNPVTLTGYNWILPRTPQVSIKGVITDRINWVREFATFEPDSNYAYVTFGVFGEDNELEIDTFDIRSINGNQPNEIAYYFLDDVLIEKYPYSQFYFTGSTTICRGETTAVQAYAGVSNVTWTLLSDTTKVICTGITLSQQPLETTSYRVKSSGCYQHTVDTVTIFVNPIPEPELGEDTVVCSSDNYVLDAGEFSHYKWNDGTEARYKEVKTSGNYRVEVLNEFGCKKSDERNFIVKDVPIVNLGRDSLLCGAFYPLHAGSGFNEYEWSTGERDEIFIPSENGKYWVTVKNECGNATDTVQIFTYTEAFVPNVVSPNNDNKNDVFTMKDLGDADFTTRLTIYNRWGQSIYSNADYNGDWPLNADVTSGIYYYDMQLGSCPTIKCLFMC